MISRILGVWLLATMLAGGTVKAGTMNIVLDPSFESGVPSSYTGAMGDGWVVTLGTGAICSIIPPFAGCGNAGPAHTGNQMAFLDWGNFPTVPHDPPNRIAQTLTTVAGESYAISYWVDDDEPNSLQVTFGGSTLFSGTAPTSGVYVQYLFPAVANSTSTVLAFTGARSTTSGGTLLDDVSVVPLSAFEGGPSSSPVFLLGDSVGGVTGTIGGIGSQEYYSFLWSGGDFSASAGITGANTGASYLFSEGVVGSCSSGATQTLNSGDNFTSTIDIPNLAAGQYCIGIDANNINDPTFTLVFNTPVSGVPEPSGFLLLSAGLGVFSALRLKKNCSRKDS